LKLIDAIHVKEKKVSSEQKLLNVEIDKGVHENKKIVFSGESSQEPGLETGDIIFVVQETPHDVFKRNGNDLIMEREIQLIDALTGFSFKINHLDARPVIIEIKKGQIVKPGDVREVPGLGMPVYSKPYEFGSLFIRFNVKFPNKLSNEQTVDLKKVFEPSTPPKDEGCEKVTAVACDAERLNKRKEDYQNRPDSDEDGNYESNSSSSVQCNQQ